MTEAANGPGTPATALLCPKCSLPFDALSAAGSTVVHCSACRSRLSVALFPAFHKPPTGVSTASGERAGDGEAVCFFHPDKRAEISCERCGRFICALCDMPLGARHICPKCLDSSKLVELVPSRFVGAYVAMLMGLLPIIFFPIALGCFYLLPLTGSSAIAFALWSWNKPGSLVHGARHGMAMVGILGGLLQYLVLAGMIAGIFYGIKNAPGNR